MNMVANDYLQRFGGIARLYGEAGLAKLQSAHIAVIGIGGIGSWVVEALARTGIGKITLIDMDDICITNINRQIHALSGNFGKLKSVVMKERAMLINPECQIEIIDDFLTLDNLSDYIQSDYDYVIDAIDNAPIKAGLIAYCKRNKIKLITMGGAGGQTDPSQIRIADLSRTIQDPLASKVRMLLRKRYHFSQNPQRKFGVECVYSTQPLIFPQVETACHASATMNCTNGFGAVTMVTATFAFFAVSRIVEKLLNTNQ